MIAEAFRGPSRQEPPRERRGAASLSLSIPRPPWLQLGTLPRLYNPHVEQEAAGIIVIERRIEPAELGRLVALYFEDMVKYVVDVERKIAAVGGELHADAEALLLDRGSRQADLWGANYYPGRGPDGCIELTALINIRPAQGNRSMAVEDPGVRDRMREITFALLGEGDPLP